MFYYEVTDTLDNLMGQSSFFPISALEVNLTNYGNDVDAIEFLFSGDGYNITKIEFL